MRGQGQATDEIGAALRGNIAQGSTMGCPPRADRPETGAARLPKTHMWCASHTRDASHDVGMRPACGRDVHFRQRATRVRREVIGMGLSAPPDVVLWEAAVRVSTGEVAEWSKARVC